jgi:hypothetical protein
MSSLNAALQALMDELLHGSPNPTANTYMLNQGDEGLLRALERLSPGAASASSHGGASIAQHVDHLRYGYSLLNRWAAGEQKPWKDADWTLSWKKSVTDEKSWRALLSDFRREADAWLSALGTPRELDDEELKWFIGTVAHLGYHMGAIRQIDRATRGPTAEDEQRAKQRRT